MGGQDITCDDRALHIYHLSACTVEASIVYYYPRLIPLCEAPEESTVSELNMYVSIRDEASIVYYYPRFISVCEAPEESTVR